MSTCGRPAVPSTSARPSDTKSSFEVLLAPYCAPGAVTSRPSTASACASTSREERLKPNFVSTHSVITRAPAIRSVALMICT
jgi:hypothetical protein